jgi:uncharacterized protein YkwD
VAAAAAAFVFAGSAESATLTRSETSLVTVMNEVRVVHDLAPLHLDFRLERAARYHSREMLRSGAFFHGAFASRIRSTGVRAPRLGENLAWGTGRLSRARAIISMWLASPEHRAVLLHPGFRAVGVAAPTGRFGGYAHARVITADFAGR